ncbi:RagB/SusD family nutrient uptake outer membrane protein [Persicobacter psychrovividus]|uniref:Starch-binding protein n=1 Tax=Persicobacter psychrovividus TaxID=387638 RepID=A0ABM7VE40_9BACT|nr:starch-binding protein [Persicobacter psychrovividus]
MKFFNQKRKGFGLLCAALMLGGCVQFDDKLSTEEFPGSEVEKSTYNLEMVLAEGYRFWAQAVVKNHVPDALVISDYSEASLDENSNTLGAFQNRYDYVRTEFRNDNLWNDSYSAINQMNQIIKISEDNKPVDMVFASQRGRLEGESRFIRAYTNFMLVRYYGKQYDPNTASTDPGIVLRTAPAEGFATGGRASVQEVYDLVLEDLEIAMDSLPQAYNSALHSDFIGYRYRANKYDAGALKARVLFQMNKIKEARLAVEKLIGNSYGSIVDMPEIAPAAMQVPDVNTVTDLFTSASLAAGSGLRNTTANYVISEPLNLMSTAKELVKGAASNIFMNKEFMLNYMNEQGDFKNSDTLRLRTFVKETPMDPRPGQEADTVYIFNKFMLEGSNNVNWPSIRLAELLLIRMECLALEGGASAAVRDLNLLRQLRGAKQIESTPPAAELLEIIALERALELVGEGERFFNWKRMGAYNAIIENKYSSVAYHTFSRRSAQDISWDGPETLYRIPLAEIQRNPDLSDADQNP